jgi:hypothetical protein
MVHAQGVYGDAIISGKGWSLSVPVHLWLLQDFPLLRPAHVIDTWEQPLWIDAWFQFYLFNPAHAPNTLPLKLSNPEYIIALASLRFWVLAWEGVEWGSRGVRGFVIFKGVEQQWVGKLRMFSALSLTLVGTGNTKDFTHTFSRLYLNDCYTNPVWYSI